MDVFHLEKLHSPRYSFILWLCFRNRLSIAGNLWYMDVHRNCGFCHTHLETVEHLFFVCPVTGTIWKVICEWLGIRRPLHTLHSSVEWMKKEWRGARLTRIALACTVYSIWKARNTGLFGGAKATSDEMILQIKVLTYKILYRLYPSNMINF
ncbi:unnamed protein product [Cuscuta epithymum]|uniref:Reverse transcriptase zinc-binding domain-containing protein n=1 Tax=Cuscuta epithymum TaxID=186058 RepID=A0AAV0EE04_9ASTE|nr:unnamed protein product [Cuscuta epithymum]